MRKDIFDNTRKRRVALTPEESVRQQLIHTLTEEYGVPLQMICCEYSFKIGEMSYRCDIVVFNNRREAILLAECKAPSVRISNSTMDQIFKYNRFLNIKNLLITNGVTTYFAEYDTNNKRVKFLEEIPHYNELSKQ